MGGFLMEFLTLEHFDPAGTLVISVDINNGFCRSGALASSRIEKLIPGTAAFLESALKRGFPVVAFTDTHPEDSPEFAGYPPHCLATSEESRLVDELAFLYVTAGAEVLPKNSTNGFFSMRDSHLQDYGTYIITGCCTDICVHQLAVTLKAYFNERNINKEVIAVRELIDTFDGPDHPAGTLNDIFFASMAANGIKVVDRIG